MGLRTLCLASLAAASLAAAAGCNGSRKNAEIEAAAASRSGFVGERAPAFALCDEDERLVRLGELDGRWVVLYFYRSDDTPGCACQATEFTHLLGEFGDMNAVVLGVGPDSPASHRRFIEKYDLQLSLLSDPTHEAMRAYGAWAEVLHGRRRVGRVIRSTVIIDPGGVVRAHWPEVYPHGHAERVRARLAELQRG